MKTKPTVKLRFKDLAKRITGVSIPVFGVSWTAPPSERQIVRETFVFLEDRRALYNDFAWELEHEVAESVLAIRRELTEALKRLPEHSHATEALTAIRAACREYLDHGGAGRLHGQSFALALGRFRTLVGVEIAYLAVKYGIDITGDLARVVPPQFREAIYLEP
jgi:Family of unknown function (DUF6650)